jgi:hypothetical protein
MVEEKKLSKNGRLSARHRHWENIPSRERSFVWFDSDAIAKSDRASGVRGNTFSRNYDADEIQRICCGNRRNFARRILFTLGSQRFHGQGQGELLAQKSTDKPAATDFSSVFQASERNQHVPPFRKNGFARKKFAEDDSVAMQQHPARRFKRPGMVVGITGIEQRPAAGTVSRTRGSTAALAGAPFGVDQRPQIVEAVRRQQSCGDKFPESGFYFSLQFARAAHNICKEGSAALSQKL